MSMNKSGFETGSGCYVCRLCGKETRETGGGESSGRLCAACDARTMAENSHNDAGHKPGESPGDCLICAGHDVTPEQKHFHDMTADELERYRLSGRPVYYASFRVRFASGSLVVVDQEAPAPQMLNELAKRLLEDPKVAHAEMLRCGRRGEDATGELVDATPEQVQGAIDAMARRGVVELIAEEEPAGAPRREDDIEG